LLRYERIADWSTVNFKSPVQLFNLPSESCNHFHNIDMQCGIVVRSIVESVSQGTFLASYTTNGNILVFSLPK